MPEKKKLFLLDAMALIYRAYFALNRNPRINSKGLNTSAILGFANTLYEVLKNENPTHIAVAFDTRKPTFRHKEFTEYKANRQEMPEDIAIALPYIKKLLDAFNIPILICEGYEADDIIGTLSKKAEKEGFTTYMMTSDKDFGQLVSDNIFMYKPARMGHKAEKLGVKEICDKYEIQRPEQLIDILGLWGDQSDNIPGVPGVGEVKAKKLIREFDSIENLLENTDKLKGKLKQDIEANSEKAILSKWLATIVIDTPVEFEEENFKRKDPNKEELKELLAELEFRNFAKRIFTDISLSKEEKPPEKPAAQMDLFSGLGDTNIEVITDDTSNITNTPHNYKLTDTKEKREKLLNKLKQQSFFCFDTETTGLDPNTSEIIGVSFSYKPGEAYYVNVPDNFYEAHTIINEFKDIFEDEKIEKIGQNLKFDISMLKWYEIEVKGKFFDTMLAHYLIEPDMRHNLDSLAKIYLNYTPVSIESLIGKRGKKQLSMSSVHIDQLKEYACEDADITLQLKNVFEPMLFESNTKELFETIEMPLIPVLTSMEAEGMNLDTKILDGYSGLLLEEIKEVEKEIFELAGTEFNISSPKQLGEILFERLKISSKPKLTKTKQYSTGEEVLIKLIHRHEIVEKILDYRSLTKLKSTYVDALPNLVNPRTGRIHSSFNQAVASTGRLSSNNPNLQNIPIRTERGREIRKAFVPKNREYTLLAADYSQIELRIMAEFSGDEGMLETFNKGLDIHTATAAKVYGIDLDEVTKDQRRQAKMVNFGIIYGISAFGLSERIQIPRREAAEIIKQYFEKYPGIRKYIDKTIEFARSHGYVETIMKRRRYLRDINSNNAVVRGFAERNAINAPIQGSAADMIKIAMINIFKIFNERKFKSKMILQVHDELVFDVFKDELEEIIPVIEKNMKSAIKMKVPVEIDINTGDNWLEAH